MSCTIQIPWQLTLLFHNKLVEYVPNKGYCKIWWGKAIIHRLIKPDQGMSSQYAHCRVGYSNYITQPSRWINYYRVPSYVDVMLFCCKYMMQHYVIITFSTYAAIAPTEPMQIRGPIRERPWNARRCRLSITLTTHDHFQYPYAELDW